MNLRKYARGKPCMARIPGVCNHNPETTVLAHLNGGGMGMKQPDLLGAWCCSDCHDFCDGRIRALNIKVEPKESYLIEAIIRTQQELLKTANKHGVTLEQAIDEWARGLEL